MHLTSVTTQLLEKSSSPESNSFSATVEISCLTWSPKMSKSDSQWLLSSARPRLSTSSHCNNNNNNNNNASNHVLCCFTPLEMISGLRLA
jgi:hypothetical protein